VFYGEIILTILQALLIARHWIRSKIKYVPRSEKSEFAVVLIKSITQAGRTGHSEQLWFDNNTSLSFFLRCLSHETEAAQHGNGTFVFRFRDRVTKGVVDLQWYKLDSYETYQKMIWTAKQKSWLPAIHSLSTLQTHLSRSWYYTSCCQGVNANIEQEELHQLLQRDFEEKLKADSVEAKRRFFSDAEDNLGWDEENFIDMLFRKAGEDV
jgi:hypothetical protein